MPWGVSQVPVCAPATSATAGAPAELSFCSVSPWAAGAVPAVPQRLQPGLLWGCRRCPLLLVAFPEPASPTAPPKGRVLLGEQHSEHPKSEFCSQVSLCVLVGWSGLVFFCISAAISWGWEAAKWPRLVLSTAGTEQDTLPARPLRSLAPKGRN